MYEWVPFKRLAQIKERGDRTAKNTGGVRISNAKRGVNLKCEEGGGRPDRAVLLGDDVLCVCETEITRGCV